MADGLAEGLGGAARTVVVALAVAVLGGGLVSLLALDGPVVQPEAIPGDPVWIIHECLVVLVNLEDPVIAFVVRVLDVRLPVAVGGPLRHNGHKALLGRARERPEIFFWHVG